MHPSLEHRELLGAALNLMPSTQILNALTADDSVPYASQTPEEMDFVDLQRQRAIQNTENWFAMHAEHCINRITWNGMISDWFKQLHQNIDHFAEAAIGNDGGSGILLTRAQMELLSWQTRTASGAAPYETRLFVSTLVLIDMTLSCHTTFDQSCSTTFAELMRSRNPSLYEALIAALRKLNVEEVLRFVDVYPVTVDLLAADTELLRDHLQSTATAMKDHILSLLQIIKRTNEDTA